MKQPIRPIVHHQNVGFQIGKRPRDGIKILLVSTERPLWVPNDTGQSGYHQPVGFTQVPVQEVDSRLLFEFNQVRFQPVITEQIVISSDSSNPPKVLCKRRPN